MSAIARAAIFEGAGQPMRLTELPLPGSLQDGEMLVRLSLATICGSDLHTIQGRRTEPIPCVLGHEGVGVVIAVGGGREPWLARRVTWASTDSCGRCAPCTEFELPQKCKQVFKYGHAAVTDDSGLHGTYATHILLRRGTHVVAVPDELPDTVAAPANCALATMVAATEQLPRRCRTAVIQGAGLLGLYGCALLRAAGVARVVVVDTDATRLGLVPLFGGEPVKAPALAAVGPAGVDLVIEAAGAAAVVPEGMKLLRPGGHYALVGMVHPDSALDLTGEAIIRGCVTLRGIHNYAPHHLDKAIAFLIREHKHLPLHELISPPFPLERIDEAMTLTASRRWARVALTMEY